MATQKISEMTEAIILQDEDYVPIVQSELNKKIKIEFLRDYNKLHNKPTLNGVTIENNKKLSDYNVVKTNQGIKVNSSTNQTLELEVPSSTEMEKRSAVNKAITIATADKMAKETAHQTMTKEYLPNSQDKLKEGENQPVSYKAVKEYVDILENKVDENERDIEEKHTILNSKVDENERDIEAKVTALDKKTSQKDAKLEELINTNERDIEQKFTQLTETVNTNEQDIEQKVSNLTQTVSENKKNIEQKVQQLEQKVDTNEKDIEGKISSTNQNINKIKEDITNLQNKDNEIIDIINNGGQIYYGNEFHGETSDYGIEIESIKGNFYQEKTNGYQLFDASKLPTKSAGGATVTNNGDGSFTVSGSGLISKSLTISYHIKHEEAIKLFKVGKITFNCKQTSYPRFYAKFISKLKTVELTNDMNAIASGEITNEMINDSSFYAIIGIYGSGANIKPNTIIPMLYQSGDGTWERFTGGEPAPNPNYPLEPKFFEPREIESISKNMIDIKDRASGTVLGITSSVMDGIITASGASTGNGDISLVFNNKIMLYKNKTYSFSIDGDFNTSNTNIFVKRGDLSSFQLIGHLSTNKKSLSFTPDSNYYLSNILIRVPNTVTIDGSFKVQLEEGEIATPYIDFKGQDTTPLDITLRSLPNGVCDTYENGVITRRVGKIVFDGTQSVDVTESKNGYIRFTINTEKSLANNKQKNGLVCNKLRVLNASGYWINPETNCIAHNVSALQKMCFVISQDLISSSNVDVIKRYLESNPITVWYELATPTTEYYSFPIIPSYFNYTNAWHDSEVEANDLTWKAKTYDALLEQEQFIEEDYIKVIETDDMVSTSSNRGGAELLELDGAYEQYTTKGYQLFDASKLPTKSAGGATVTNNGDGSFTISGTGNPTSIFENYYVYSNDEMKKILKAGTVKINVETDCYPYFIFGIINQTGSWVKYVSNPQNNSSQSFTVTDDDLSNNNYRLKFQFYGTSSYAIKSGTIKPMIYIDGDGSWEQFTGGKASPNPEYKQDMKAVEVSEVNSLSKNLFNGDYLIHEFKKNGLSSYINKQTYKDRKNTILINTYDVNVRGQRLLKGLFKPNTQYHISMEWYFYHQTSSYKGSAIVVYYTDGSNSVLRASNSSEFKAEKIVTSAGKTVDSISFTFANVAGSTYIDLDKSYICEVGKYIPSEYSTTPFTQTLRALPNGVKDTYKNGILTRRVGEYKITNIASVIDSSSGRKAIVLVVPNKKTNMANIDSYLCNSAIKIIGSTVVPEDNCIYQNPSNFVIEGTSADTLETFKEKFLNTIIWYELATPQITTIDKPFIETYRPWTNIWTDSPIKTHMKIGFKNRFGEFYTKKEIDELIKNAIATIGKQMIK